MEKFLDLLPQWPIYPIILPLLIFFFLKKCSSLISSKIKLPPGPKPWPLIGNMLQLAGAPPQVILHELAKVYGPICHLRVGHLSLVSVSSSEVAREVLKTKELTFAQRAKLPMLVMASLDELSIVFSPHDDRWRQIRKISTMELLSTRRVRSFHSIRTEEVDSFIGFVVSTRGAAFNLSQKIFACINGITYRAAFGQEFERQGEFLTTLAEQLRIAGGFSLPEIFPYVGFLYHLNGTKAKMNRMRTTYEEILGSVLADHRIRRKHRGDSALHEEDLVDVLLRLQESGEIGFPLTDGMIKNVILELLGGGSETTPTQVEWAMAEMLKNPRIMTKAQFELREAFKEKGKIEEADLEKICYLKLIVKETLRLYPSLPLIGRIPREPCTVHGYDIPKDSRILVNAWSIGRDPKHWDNPDKFYPERFLRSSVEYGGTHFELLPFGAGRRMCPGIGFAVANIEILLANLLYHFDWKLANGLSPEELDMNPAMGLVIRRSKPLFVVAEPYSTPA